MSKTPNAASMIGYYKTLRDGVKYATEHDEIFEFLVATTVIASNLMNKYPEETARLENAVEEIKKVLQENVVH